MNGAVSLEDILPRLTSSRVWLMPLLSVVGRHALQDMAARAASRGARALRPTAANAFPCSRARRNMPVLRRSGCGILSMPSRRSKHNGDAGPCFVRRPMATAWPHPRFGIPVKSGCAGCSRIAEACGACRAFSNAFNRGNLQCSAKRMLIGWLASECVTALRRFPVLRRPGVSNDGQMPNNEV